MKHILFVLAVLGVMAFSASSVLAAPFNAADRNSQVVAFYQTGDHGIVGEFYLHQGTDLVMRRGNSGNFQQWFYGDSAIGLHGDHSIWNISKDGTCSSDRILVKDAWLYWGDYLVHGADYCVHTNEFKPSK